MTEGQDFKYKAFLSYSHKDAKFARRLHCKLERYRIPKKLSVSQAGLGTFFLDESDLSASPKLQSSIKSALEVSENLIVLCSPESVKSQWVEAEVSYFISLGRSDKIFIVIISGEPHAAFNGKDKQLECLPDPIRRRFGGIGGLEPDREDEPLAADFRSTADGEKIGTLKLISGLLDVGLDALLQRQLARARQKLIGLSVGAFLIVSVLTGFTWIALTAQKEAEARRTDAENFVEFLLSDLSLELEKTGRLDVLDSVGEKTVNYYLQFDKDELDSKTNARRARSFHFMGKLQNDLAKTESSRTYFEQAYEMTKSALGADGDNPERLFEHTRSAYLRSLPLRREGNIEKELTLLQEYEGLAERLKILDGSSDRSLKELANSKMNLGRVWLRFEEFGRAKEHFIEADVIFENLVDKTASVENLLALSENMAWKADVFLKERDFETHYEIRVAQTQLLEDGLRESTNDFRLLEGLVYANLGLGNAARHSGQFAEAKLHLDSALRQTDAALKLEPNREKMLRAKSAALLGLMKVAEANGEPQNYRRARATLILLMDEHVPIVAVGNKYWQDILPTALTATDKQFILATGVSP